MDKLLNLLSSKSTRYILWRVWGALLGIYAICAILPPWLGRPITAAAGVIVLVGYPFILIFGLPSDTLSRPSRMVALAAAILYALLVAITALEGADFRLPDSAVADVIGAAAGLLCFAPFFLATSALGAARRRLKLYKPLDHIATFIALLYAPFGGLAIIRRLVRPVVERSQEQSSAGLTAAWSGS